MGGFQRGERRYFGSLFGIDLFVCSYLLVIRCLTSIFRTFKATEGEPVMTSLEDIASVAKGHLIPANVDQVRPIRSYGVMDYEPTITPMLRILSHTVHFYETFV